MTMNNLLAALIAVGLSITVMANDPDPVETENQVLCDLHGLSRIRLTHFVKEKVGWRFPKEMFLAEAAVRFPRAIDMIQNQGPVYARLCGHVIDASKTHKFELPEWGAIYATCKYMVASGIIDLATAVPPARDHLTGVLTKLSSEIQGGRSVYKYALTIDLCSYGLRKMCIEMLQAANAGKDEPLRDACTHVLKYLAKLTEAKAQGSISAAGQSSHFCVG